MKTINANIEHTQDATLHWAMRIGGTLMMLSSALLLGRNVAYGISDEVFCGLCLGLGLLSFVLSLLPDREDQDEAALQPESYA